MMAMKTRIKRVTVPIMRELLTNIRTMLLELISVRMTNLKMA